jgi:MoaA/NifB/PqqE/SkfB family radical SAM enzyme
MNKTNLEKVAMYGFYDRLTEEFPSQLLVDVAELCNLECIHCPHSEFKKSQHYSGAKLDPELNIRLVDEVKLHGKGITQYIRYTSNGEPLIHPQIYEMLKYAVENSGTKVTLTTNGTLLSEKNVERLLNTGVDVVDISIDAYSRETYSKIRAKGDLDVTASNTINLINESAKRGAKSKIVVSYVESSENAHETNDFEKFWKDNGANFVVIRRLHSCSGAKEKLAVQRRNDNNSINRKPCLYPWERVVLNPKGWLDFCPSDWVEGSQIIEYKNTTIKETWGGEFYEKLRLAHLNNEFSNHKFCGQCPDWIATRWPDEGRSYADMIQDFKESE